MRKKTQHLKVTTVVGVKDYYTHELRADYPVDIEILSGPRIPHLRVDTAKNLTLNGNLNIPSLDNQPGTPDYEPQFELTLRGSTLRMGDSVYATGAAPAIQVGSDPDDHVENFTFLASSTQPLQINAGGNISVTILTDQPDAVASIANVHSTYGNVDIVSPVGLLPHNDNTTVRGKTIRLDVRNGFIGSFA